MENLSTNLQGPRKICTTIEHMHISEYFNHLNWLLKRILYAVRKGLQKVILQILRPTNFRKCTTTIIHVRDSKTQENDTHGKVEIFRVNQVNKMTIEIQGDIVISWLFKTTLNWNWTIFNFISFTTHFLFIAKFSPSSHAC